VKNSCSNEKRQIPRLFRGKNEFRGSKPAETQIQRFGAKFRGPRKTVGPIDVFLFVAVFLSACPSSISFTSYTLRYTPTNPLDSLFLHCITSYYPVWSVPAW